MVLRKIRALVIVYMFLALAVGGFARKHGSQSASSGANNTPGSFDYYQLTLSWAPQFCASQQGKAPSSECDPKRHYGLVVHGLWPQNDNGSYPQDCAPAQPVSGDIVREMLPIMPARGLIQHEWSKHGTCSGLSAQDYFAEIQQAYKQIKVPEDYQHPTQTLEVGPGKITQSFAEANGAPSDAFRVSCKNAEFVELDVCLTKDLHYRACGASTAKCTAHQVRVLPTP
jgi:ribonuclease T2